MKTPDTNDPLPVLGEKVKPKAPPPSYKPDPRLPTNDKIRTGPDGKMYTDIPENYRAGLADHALDALLHLLSR